MLENTEPRVHTSGSKCFTHPEAQQKVNVTFLFHTESYNENNVCAQWSMVCMWAAGIIPAAGLGSCEFRIKQGTLQS